MPERSPTTRRELTRLASAHGVQTSFRDVDRVTHRASRAALEAVLAAMGELDPKTPVPAPERGSGAGRGRTPGDHARMPAIEHPSWGVFLPLHALRTKGDWGVGSFTDLADLYRWTTGLGGSTVGTLPLLAQFLEEPFEYSPYSPASRLFWNELYVDPAATPEFARSRSARRFAAAAPKPRGRLVDYRKAYAAKRPVLAALAREFFGKGTPPARRGEFERFRRHRPNLDDYARFRAFGERTRAAWPDWPARQRGGRISTADVDADGFGFHRYVQFVADEQLGAIGKTAPGSGLYLDMPLGVNGASYDTWRFRDSFAWGVSGGAPPDTFFTKGQTWGFPPLHPHRIRENDFAYVRESLRHLMKHSGVIRVDHVMGLHRLFWVPDGMDARHGVYVRYPADDLFAVLSEEAHRAGTAVVGEDLGTVPRTVRADMARHGVLRSHVVQLEAQVDHHEDPLRPPPRGSLASLNTHDMAPFAAFLEGLDVDDRLDLGLIDSGEATRERHDRRRLTRRLTTRFRQEGALHGGRAAIVPAPDATDAAHRYLAASRARMVVVNLEDQWGETQPQNRPGTYRERPNWRLRAARTFESFRSDPAILGRLEEVNRLREEAATRERRGRRSRGQEA
jgi:4-alpha-glucanotransferase